LRRAGGTFRRFLTRVSWKALLGGPARALRSADIGIQLIAVSGYALSEDVKRAIEAGFGGHVPKPCDPDEIEPLLG
jgi:hypothetical protein